MAMPKPAPISMYDGLILKALEAGTQSVDEAHARIGFGHRDSIRRAMRSLHARQQVHVRGWRRREGGRLEALYAVGSGRDAPRPVALTNAQKAKRWRDSLQDDARDKLLARKRLDRRLKAPRPDPAAAWINGSMYAD